MTVFSSRRERNRWLRIAAKIQVEMMPTDPSTVALSFGALTLAGRMAVP